MYKKGKEKNWSKIGIINWGLGPSKLISDMLSRPLYTRTWEVNDTKVTFKLTKRNKSTSPWQEKKKDSTAISKALHKKQILLNTNPIKKRTWIVVCFMNLPIESYFQFWHTSIACLSILINKGNNSIPLFEIPKSIKKRKKKSGLQTKTEGNSSNIRELRHNENTSLNVTHTEMNYNITRAIFLTR